MEKSILSRFNAFLFRLIKECIIFGGLALIALTFLGVLTRYVFRVQTTWAYEISILLLVWVCFLGAAAGVKTKSHVNFDAIINLFPVKIRRYLFILKYLFILLISVAGVYFGYKVILKTLAQQFQTIPVSVSLLYAALPVTFFLMICFYFEELLVDIRENFGARKDGGV